MLQMHHPRKSIVLLFSVLTLMGSGSATRSLAAAAVDSHFASQPDNAGKMPPGIIRIDDSTPPIPVPADAASVNYDAEAGSLEFESPTDVKQLADFYRGEMKKLGWSEQPSVIHNDNMVQLQFSKADDELSFTLLKMGDHTQFSGEGPALASKAASGSDSGGQAQTADAGSVVQLTAEDKDGFPIPSDHSASGTESTLFRKSVDVSVSANVSSVVAFYRTELGKKGWKEQADKSVVKDDAADLVFDSPDGPVKLQIKRNADLTTATLSTRDQAAASKSPLYPKPGQVKVMLGNITDKAASVTIGSKHVKVPANAGGQEPNGPTVDLAPGKITVAIKGAGTDSFEAGPDEIWMVMIGPGGILPVQAY